MGLFGQALTIREGLYDGLLLDGSMGEHVIERSAFLANRTGIRLRGIPELVSLAGLRFESNREHAVRSHLSENIDAAWSVVGGCRRAIPPASEPGRRWRCGV